jgi:hypothetical protein
MDMEKCLAECERYKEYVRNNANDLRGKYGSDYIAVLNNQVIDHDKDQFKLAGRIKRNYRGTFVLINTLEDILNPKQRFLEIFE